MNSYEKCKLLGETIKELYLKERKSISYISRLLKINRRSISNFLRENEIVVPFIKTRDFNKLIEKEKDKIISLLKNGVKSNDILKEFRLSRSEFKELLKIDKEIYDAYTYRSSISKKYIGPIKDEVWKEILGFPNYEVSNLGRVKNIHGLLTPQSNVRNAYEEVSMTGPDGKRKMLKIHRLVAHAFCEGFSEIRNTVNHIDGNKLNNKASNLEWVSQSENNKHAYTALSRPVNIGKPIDYIISYKGKYQFKTIASFARFIEKSETQARRWIEECPEKHEIKKIKK